jgi:predicted permease
MSATIVCLVALVVGGNTTVYGLVHAILTKPARGVATQQLVTLQRFDPGDSTPALHQYTDFEVFSDSASMLHNIAAVRLEPVTLRVGASTEAVRGASVTVNYFELFGITLLHGRAFTEGGDRSADAALVVAISEQLWRTRFDSRPDIVGQPVFVSGQAATVTGVVPAVFRGATLGELTDVWVPLRAFARLTGGEAALLAPRPSVQVFGQLADGRSLSNARAEISSLMDGSHRDAPRESRPTAAVVPYSMTTASDSLIAQVAPRFLILFSVVTALTLLIVCANIANLVWSRAISRHPEMALRVAVGATRWHILRGAAAEALVLGALAWGAASVFAWAAVRLIVRVTETQAGGALAVVDFSPDTSVLAYAALLTFSSVAVCSLGPSVRPIRADLNAIVGKAGPTQRRSWLSRALIVAQFAFSVVLLVIAGLAYRTVSAAQAADLGFNPDRLLLVRVDTTDANIGDGQLSVARERIRQTLQGLAEIEAASYASTTPAVRGRKTTVSATSRALPVTAERMAIGPEFFRVLGLVPRQGHEFSPDDEARGLPVAIVNRSLADRLWPGMPNVVGQALVLHEDPERQVQLVAVVPDALFTGPRGQAAPAFVFLPQGSSERRVGTATFYVRHRGNDQAVASLVRRTMTETDQRVPVVSITSMTDSISALTAPQRMIVRMAIVFAAVSLLIGAVGLHGLISFSVRQRTREFGVRQAVGASRATLLRLVLAEGLVVTLVGVGTGCLLGGLVAAGGRAYLFGVSPLDIATYASIVSIVAVVAIIAVCGPALRASRVNPLVALRAG